MLNKWFLNGVVVGLFEYDDEVYDLFFSEYICVFFYDYKMYFS